MSKKKNQYFKDILSSDFTIIITKRRKITLTPICFYLQVIIHQHLKFNFDRSHFSFHRLSLTLLCYLLFLLLILPSIKYLIYDITNGRLKSNLNRDYS